MDAYYDRHDFRDVVVLDPFMGGGTTVGECLRLGAKVVGCALNPVAWFLVSQALRAVEISTLLDSYQQVADAVAGPLADMYRTRCEGCGGEAHAQYTAWVKQAPCEQCGAAADLHLNSIVMADMATRGAGLVDCPACGHPWWVEAVREPVACPRCEHRFTPAEPRSRNTHYHCDCCGHGGRILDALEGTEGPPDHRMRCLTVWCPSCGKRHQAPTAEDVDDRREAVHNDGRGRDGDFYAAVLGNVFVEALRTLKPGGRMAFTFHHGGEDAWSQLASALSAADLVVERWWPVFAEMESGVPLRSRQNNGHLDVVFVCGRRAEVRAPAVQETVGEMTRHLSERGPLVPADERALLKAEALAAETWAGTTTLAA